jgi:hypothetical protein
MRPSATWVVIGALALIGLFAARDALRSDEAPASAPATTTLAKQRRTPPAQPPEIADRGRLAAELRALGAEGVLYLTDANCHRFLLRLPSLAWTPQGLPGPVCPNPTVVDERFGLEATQVDADVIEVRSEDWSLRFEGTAPAFRPEGRLTFIRDGRLLEWTVRCPPSADRVVFRGRLALIRCPHPVGNAPDRLREVVWLNSHDFVGIAGQELYSTLAVVRPGGSETIFRAIGARMGSLSASPDGRYVSVRIDGQLAVFDVERARQVPLPAGAEQATRAIDWSPDGAYVVIASLRSLHVFPASRPDDAVTLPLSEIDTHWR